METPPTNNNQRYNDDDHYLQLMNTPQFLNYMTNNELQDDHTPSSPIQSSSSRHLHHHTIASSNNTNTLNNHSHEQKKAPNNNGMMNMALTMLLLSPKKNDTVQPLIHTPTMKNKSLLNSISSPLGGGFGGGGGDNRMVRRVLDFDESMESFEDVPLEKTFTNNGVIRNTFHIHDGEEYQIEKIGLGNSADVNSTSPGDSLFVSYFHRIMSLLLAVLLFPTSMIMKKEQAQSPVVLPVVNQVDGNHTLVNPMLDHYIGKIEYQQKRIDELETIIKKMNNQVEKLVKSNEDFEKRVNNMEEKSQRDLCDSSSISESVDSETLIPVQEEDNKPALILESIPKDTSDPSSVFLFIALPIVVAISSLL